MMQSVDTKQNRNNVQLWVNTLSFERFRMFYLFLSKFYLTLIFPLLKQPIIKYFYDDFYIRAQLLS